MILFIFGLLFALAALIVLATSKLFPSTLGAVCGGGVSLVIGILMVFISCFNVVQAREIGVVTSFGKVIGKATSGVHMLAPWAGITTMDATIQTDSQRGTTCVQIRIAHQQTACVNVTIRWRIEPNAVDELYKNYRTFSNVRTSLVTRELDVALNQQFANYDPIASLVSTHPEGTPQNPTVIQLGSKVLGQMKTDLAGQIHVLSILIPSLNYDPSVQNRINSVLAQTAQTDIAKQAEQTASAQSAANKLLAGSVSNDPGVLVSRCIDLVNEAIKANYTLPPGFSCFGSSSVGVLAGKP